jgi:hypothetical protein
MLNPCHFLIEKAVQLLHCILRICLVDGVFWVALWRAGMMVEAEVTDATSYDLYGRILGPESSFLFGLSF